MDRVAVVAWCWFILWIACGYTAGSTLFNTPWTGGLTGFVFAFFGVFSWPWFMPERINQWMDDPLAWAD